MIVTLPFLEVTAVTPLELPFGFDGKFSVGFQWVSTNCIFQLVLHQTIFHSPCEETIGSLAPFIPSKRTAFQVRILTDEVLASNLHESLYVSVGQSSVHGMSLAI